MARAGIMTARETPESAPIEFGYPFFNPSYMDSNGILDATKRSMPNQRDIEKIIHNPHQLLLEKIREKIKN